MLGLMHLLLKILSTDDAGPGWGCVAVGGGALAVAVASAGAAPRLDVGAAVFNLPVSAPPARISCSLHATWGDTAVRSTGTSGTPAEGVLWRELGLALPSLPDAAVCARLCMLHTYYAV